MEAVARLESRDMRARDLKGSVKKQVVEAVLRNRMNRVVEGNMKAVLTTTLSNEVDEYVRQKSQVSPD